MSEYYKSLSLLGLTDKKRKQLEKKGIHDITELLMFLPRKYKIFGKPGPVCVGEAVILFDLEYVNTRIAKSGMDLLIASGNSGGHKVSVVWFRQSYRYDAVYALRGHTVLAAGNVTYDPEWDQYTMASPDIFCLYDDTDPDRDYILPVYSKINGMSDDFLTATIKTAASDFQNCISSQMPTVVETRLGLMDFVDAVYIMHFPDTKEDLLDAQKRIRAEKMFYFAMMMREDKKEGKKKSPFRIQKVEVFNQIIQSLPYKLTKDQMETARSFCSQMLDEKPIHALVQGDVGCGKSIIAFLCMALIGENGYQSALMAPTSVLARQHYEDLQKLMEPFGISVEFVPPLTSLKKKEREQVLKRISDGESKIIIGTHALLSDEIAYQSLGLIVTDEEHKFGVEQREKLATKTSDGAHYITMSATPIPRSLANVIYGDQTQLCLIQSMPAGRKPVQTAISNNFKSCASFVKKQIGKGRQVYVVCPQIESNEKMEGVTSVEELQKIYSDAFGADAVCTLTGKNSKKETEQILSDFKENKKSILIATTVIEVGVNVPNANTIIIHNAERFGLAGLHQLRGRVGRGGGDAYCILFSKDRENERLLAMCRTTNGFEIAEEDLKLRGAGNLFGTEQSGMNEYIDLVLSYPEEYKKMKAIVNELF